MSENFDEELMCVWAKKREANGQFFWLPLKQHLEDTANVIEHLWDRWFSKGQRDFISAGITSKSQNSLDGEKQQQKNNAKTAKKLAIFLAAIHDIGKATPAFCTRKGFSNSPDLDSTRYRQRYRWSGAGGRRLCVPVSGRQEESLCGCVT